MGGTFYLGDSAYISADFPFVLTPSRDNGNLSPEEQRWNQQISKGRVVIENCFGILKCRWRKLRDIQNYRMDFIVKIVLAAFTLHEYICDAHPNGCPGIVDDIDNTHANDAS